MNVVCCDKHARAGLLADSNNIANGFKSVEIDYGDPTTLHVSYFKTPSLVKVTIVDLETNEPVQTVDSDFDEFEINGFTPVEGRTYRLKVQDASQPDTMPIFWDPSFATIDFTFNETVNTETDFLQPEEPSEPRFPAPAINYLAKDYASFRQLVLDRMAITMPNWQETHAADLGMTLVELLAFVADRISYEQDAVATEAYLGTARLRSSVRRHARLVDYRMHEGCNARGFVHLQVRGSSSFAPGDLQFTTDFPKKFQLPSGMLDGSDVSEEALDSVVVFEAISRPVDDWRVTDEQVKSINDFKDRADRLQASFFKTDTLPAFTDVKHGLTSINLWLSEFDLYSAVRKQNVGKSIDRSVKVLLSGISHLSIPQRNRAILDRALTGIISPARFDDRITLHEALNEIHFYTWDGSSCWLEKGATRAVLADFEDAKSSTCQTNSKTDPGTRKLDALRVGDYFLFEEVLGPLTGSPADADRTKRHVVRITRITKGTDPVYQNADPPEERIDDSESTTSNKTSATRDFVEIEWDLADALPFPICISSKLPPPYCRAIENVSVARGNIVLVDHGRRLDRVELGTVESVVRQIDCGDEWNAPSLERKLLPFQPVIDEPGLTYSQPFLTELPASQCLKQELGQSVPSIGLIGIHSADSQNPIRITPEFLESGSADGLYRTWHGLRDEERYVLEDLLEAEEAHELLRLVQLPSLSDDDKLHLKHLLNRLLEELTWESRFDLLGSDSDDRHFVAEIDERRKAHLRFGDGEHGKKLDPGTSFSAQFRIGSGSKGNVGTEMIRRVVVRQNAFPAVTQVRNPLPAQGGTDPEPIEQAKLLAPHAFRKNQPRALVPGDYSALVKAKYAGRIQSVHAASRPGATFQWIDVAIDPVSTEPDRNKLIFEIQEYLDRVRRIGHLVWVTEQVHVPVDLTMSIFVDPRIPRQIVQKAVSQRLGNHRLDDGTLGFFHADRLTLGQSIHSNEIVREVLQVDGVQDARVISFGRLNSAPTGTDSSVQWQEFVLQLGTIEVAQLETNSPSGGRLTLKLEGGR